MAQPALATRPQAPDPVAEDPAASRERWTERLGASRVVRTHAFPANQDGVVRQVTWFETPLKQPLVRVEQRWAPSDAPDGPGLKLLDEQAMVASHVLVGLESNVSPEAAITSLRAAGFDASPVAHAFNLVSVSVPSPVEPESFDVTLASLQRSPYHLAFAEPDALILIDAVTNDPRYPAQWSLTSSGEDAPAALNAEAGWLVSTDASDVIVAITDTGTRTTHEDLVENLWSNPAEIAGNGIDDDDNGVIDDVNGFNAIDSSGNVADDNGHGTHVSGIIGARGNNTLGISGVAWNVRLMTGKFLNNRGIGTSSDAVAAIHYARLNGAHLINASWSTNTRSLALEDAIRQTGEAGIVFVAAAGNQRSDIDAVPRYPAATDLPNIVAVAATDRSRSLTAFSNYGRDRVHLAAPGEGILSTYHQSDSQYVLLSGSSMAAPHVTGALALLKSVHPSEDGLQLIQRLLAGTRLSPSLAGLVQTGGILHLPTLLTTDSSTPRHDLRTAPYLFNGYHGVWSGSTTHAGRSPDDPTGLGGDRTLWFSWTPPASGHAQWQVDGAESAMFSTVYRLDSTTLTPLQTNSGDHQTSRVWVETGSTYLLGVGTTSPSGHAITVNLALPPANDLIAKAGTLTGESFSTTGNNRGATRETTEPRHARVGGGRSVWWEWTAPRTTRQVITTLDSAFDTVLAVYRTSAGGELIEVAANDDSGFNLRTSRVAFDATEGTRYLIAVDGYGSESGAIRLGGYGLGNILILSDPVSQAVRLGVSVTLQVRFLSTLDTRVQWYKDDQPIGGGGDGKLIVGNVGPGDLGNYHAVISNADESVASNPAALTEFVSAPFISWSTGNLNEVAGNPVTLRVSAHGSMPFTFQWFKNDEPVPGATAESLYFEAITEADAGQYHLVITNATGSTRSPTFSVRVTASPLAAWSWATAPDQGWSINDLRYFGDTYHALASAGKSTKILRSQDGINWSTQLLPPAFRGIQIAEGNDTLIVAGQDHTSFGNGSIYRSTDGGTTWTIAGLPFRGTVPALQFGNGHFVALTSYDGTLRRSVNGTSWQAPVTPPANGMTHLTFQGGAFFAYNNFNKVLYRSVDGDTWTIAHTAIDRIGGVFFHDGVYHLWTATTYSRSTDATTWEHIGTNTDTGSQLMVHDGIRFVNAGSGFKVSDTGQTWTTQTIPTTGGSATIKSLLRAGGRTVVGFDNGLIVSSPDTTKLEDTSKRFTWFGGSNTRIQFSEGEFILSGASLNQLAFSGDGATWKTFPVISQAGLNGSVIWKAGGYYWANSVGTNKTFWRGRSPTGLKRVVGSPSDTIGSIVYYENRYLAIAGTQLVTSVDGDSWTQVDPGFTPSSAARLHVAGGRCFMIGYNTIASSTDGLSWQVAARPNATSHDFAGFAENNGKFYVVTQTYNQIWESTDGVTWTVHPLPFSTSGMTGFYAHRGALMCVVYPDNTGEQLHFTTDLVTWQVMNTGISASYFATGNDIMVGLSPTPHVVYNGSPAARAPLCRILTPRTDTQITLNNVIEIAVDASAPDGLLDRVELYVDDTLVATSTTPGVFRHGFSATENRIYSFHARAYNPEGLVTTDSALVTAKSPTPPPTFVPSTAFTSSFTFSDEDGYYAVSGDALYRSTDGVNWEFHPISTNISSINEFSLDESYTRLNYTNGTKMIVSRDGVDWISIATTSAVQYRSGVYFRFTGSLASGTGSVALSSNGSAWQHSTTRSQTYFTSVLMGDGPRYVGWSSSLHPYVRRSDDGVNWVNIPGLPIPHSGVEALNRFILRYSDNTTRTSTDGITWETGTLGSGAVEKLMPIGDVVFAVYGSSLKKVSIDGLVWNTVLSPDVPAQVAYADGFFVSAGSSDVRRSTDGITWTSTPAPWANASGSAFILHGPAGFMVFKTGGPGWLSVDGVTWTEAGLTASDGGSWQQYLAIGDNQIALRDVPVSSNPLKRSVDAGKTWSFSTPPYAYPVGTKAIYSTGAAFVLRDSNGKLYRSTDGAAWTEAPVVVEGAAVPVIQLIANGNLWHAVANNGFVYRSTDDGVTWARHVVSAESGVNLIDLHFSGLHYLAVANAAPTAVPLVFRSDDGVTWTPTTLPANVTSSSRRSAGHGRFVIIQGITTHLSDNGIDWTTGASSPVVNGSAYPASDGFYMMTNGDLYRSANADGWTLIRTGIPGGVVELNGVLHAYNLTSVSPIYFADAAAHAAQVSAGTYGIGDTLMLQATIANVGQTDLPDMDVALYLSRDTFHDNSDDLPIGTLTIAAASLPPPGETRVIPLSLVLPPTLEGGIFYVGLRLDPDHQVGEFSKSNNRRFTTTAPVTVPEWTLDLQTVGDGGVAQSVSAVRYVHGSTVSLVPNTGKNSTFAGWSGSESSDRPDLTVTMRDNKALTATFATTRQLSALVRGAGTVQLDQASGSYAHGTHALLQAQPAPGWEFAGWEEDLTGSTAQRTLLMDADRVVVARFSYPKENWRAAHFSAAELADPAISDDTATPGPLGVSNLLSYLSGRDPRSSAPFSTAPEVQPENLFYRYTRNTGAVGASLIAEASENLVAWTVPLSERVIGETDGVETVEVIIPRANHTRVFIRLRSVPDPEEP